MIASAQEHGFGWKVCAALSRRAFAGALLLGVVVFQPGFSLAETQPEDTLKEIVGKMKSEGSPAVIVDYVNWPRAFERFPEQQREQLEVKDADQMKAFFQEMLAHPADVMKKQMESRLSTVPPEKQEEAKESIARMYTQMQGKEAEMKERLAGTEFIVGKAKVEGEKATVELTQTYKDQKRTETVVLEKDKGRWVLPSVSMGGQQPSSPTAAAPVVKAKPTPAKSTPKATPNASARKVATPKSSPAADKKE